MDQETKVKNIEDKFLSILEPLFFPKDPVSNDIINYFSSLLRVGGYEGKGWDPYLESENVLEDLNKLVTIELPLEHFPDLEITRWRLALLFYSHAVEMEAIYEIITNLLRFKLGKGYNPNPYFDFLTPNEKKNFAKKGIYPAAKIKIIKNLSKEADIAVGDIFDEFYHGKLRNAVSHSDYIITENSFRCRNGNGAKAFEIKLEELNDLILKTKIFISVFFKLHKGVRQFWGKQKNRGVPYDSHYKGLMEVLVDENNLMCGFKIHWPNNSESYYKRTEDGCQMVNMWCSATKSKIETMVGLYPKNHGDFSLLLEPDKEPQYTKLDSGETPAWKH